MIMLLKTQNHIMINLSCSYCLTEKARDSQLWMFQGLIDVKRSTTFSMMEEGDTLKLYIECSQAMSDTLCLYTVTSTMTDVI